MTIPLRQIRARYTADTLTVYQAYPPEIAGPAVAAGRFVPPFKRDRMTWIKPSFRWMMYRCGWARKAGQERVLAVEISRVGFEWALAHACLSGYEPGLHADRDDWARQLRSSPARVQWDPERTVRAQPLPHRSLQMGLTGEAARRYVDEWLVDITDVTATAHAIRGRLDADDDAGAESLLPAERPYPLPDGVGDRVRDREERRCGAFPTICR
ncbi:DUF4291 domain-containing protein [Micromonospora sp. RTGN7]|uniref:DUF4291 domain-containing protein n=1 Tax=Micromonospora sp. RTGN7 TaxID=3016526 RepID=UPI0029FF045C|nr:DUF4291 domain-containing protein [Micromonospora sp. RTGN7]